jgi:hypothetical protein
MRSPAQSRELLTLASTHEDAVTLACRVTPEAHGSMSLDDARARLRTLAMISTDAEAIELAQRVAPEPAPPPPDPDDPRVIEAAREREETRRFFEQIEFEDRGYFAYKGPLGSGHFPDHS